MNAGWWEAPLTLRDLAQAISITRSKISYSLIEPQPLLCTLLRTCSYEFHALVSTHTPHSQRLQSHPNMKIGRMPVVELFCRNSLHVKAVECFHRGAPSLMFDGILNVTLSEKKASNTGVTQGNLKFLLRTDSPDSHQTQIQEDETLDWPHVPISLKENSSSW